MDRANLYKQSKEVHEMRILVGMMAIMAVALSTAMPAVAGTGSWDSGCSCMRDRLLGPPPTVNTNAAIAGALSQSTSTSGAVGISAGGAGGNAPTDNANNNNVRNNLRTGDSSSTASGNGANISYNAYFPMQVPELPPTIVTGGITLMKVGNCGPRVKVSRYKPKKYTPEFLGFYQKSDEVQSLQGRIRRSAKRAFIIKTYVMPKELGGEKKVFAYGDQLYLSVGSDGQGGGAGGAANYASRTAVGLGAALDANSTFGIVGEVAVRCLYAESVAKPKLASVKLNVVKAEVLAVGGKWRIVKSRKGPALCGGKRIPPNHYCAFFRNHLGAVTHIGMEKK